MQIILLQRVEKLGQMGDVVEVSNGYARNFLLPQKKALRASKANLDLFQNQKTHLEAENLKRRDEAEAVAKKMDNVSITMIRQASETGHLYGSVRNADIADMLKVNGYGIARGQVHLDTPIKNLGIHKARVVLHPEVSIYVSIVVSRSEEEAAVEIKKAKISNSNSTEEAVAAEA
ncbi:50S ribosomal protein L9 [Candidatus Odyssella acanthamoebae]|uniref:Large ribosomal subunit protein bL9 n=1 Tax=Candidatus Odyssella acanthamoebae TaxID=91604 RepID=A0A077B1P7_9PROT|nr:50S ribosomal protein L9 [Candidatus Paracaedibacter acanthamoebae]AIK96865.1 50S ribosomal protein L9 [Candidatus Paracaedibacter acanthamoebae]